MRAEAAPEPGDPLEQDAGAPPVEDPAVAAWFLREDERRNPATDLRVFTAGNQVTPLVDGGSYFRRLCEELKATDAGDQMYFVDFRGDMDELLDGPGTEVGDLLIGRPRAAAWPSSGCCGARTRSWLHQSEEANAEFARQISDNGGQVLLDARTRRAGSHHQKLVVIRHPEAASATSRSSAASTSGFSRGDDSAAPRRPAGHDRSPTRTALARRGTTSRPRSAAPPSTTSSTRSASAGTAAACSTSRARLRMLYDRAYHAGAMTGRPLPEPLDDDPRAVGSKAVQVLRTYPARLRRYPFAPHGERSIAHAYRRAFTRARRLVYLEDQYLWSAMASRRSSARH